MRIQSTIYGPKSHRINWDFDAPQYLLETIGESNELVWDVHEYLKWKEYENETRHKKVELNES